MFVDRCLGKGPLGTEVADLQWLLLRKAGRHDFPKKAQHLFVSERSFVTLEHRTQYLSLPFRAIVIDRRSKLAFGNAYLLRVSGALVD